MEKLNKHTGAKPFLIMMILGILIMFSGYVFAKIETVYFGSVYYPESYAEFACDFASAMITGAGIGIFMYGIIVYSYRSGVLGSVRANVIESLERINKVGIMEYVLYIGGREFIAYREVGSEIWRIDNVDHPMQLQPEDVWALEAMLKAEQPAACIKGAPINDSAIRVKLTGMKVITAATGASDKENYFIFSVGVVTTNTHNPDLEARMHSHSHGIPFDVQIFGKWVKASAQRKMVRTPADTGGTFVIANFDEEQITTAELSQARQWIDKALADHTSDTIAKPDTYKKTLPTQDEWNRGELHGVFITEVSSGVNPNEWYIMGMYDKYDVVEAHAK